MQDINSLSLLSILSVRMLKKKKKKSSYLNTTSDEQHPVI